jgi:hypothetical protein
MSTSVSWLGNHFIHKGPQKKNEMENYSRLIYIHMIAIINKQFNYFSTAYSKENQGEECPLSLEHYESTTCHITVPTGFDFHVSATLTDSKVT